MDDKLGQLAALVFDIVLEQPPSHESIVTATRTNLLMRAKKIAEDCGISLDPCREINGPDRTAWLLQEACGVLGEWLAAAQNLGSIDEVSAKSRRIIAAAEGRETE